MTLVGAWNKARKLLGCMWVWTRDKKHLLKGCQTWCGLLLNIWILTAVKANSHSKGLSCVKTCFWSSSSAYLLFFSIVNFHEFLALKQHNCFQELFFGVLRLQIFFLISKIILWWTFLLSKSKSIWQRAICYIFGFSSKQKPLQLTRYRCYILVLILLFFWAVIPS